MAIKKQTFLNIVILIAVLLLLIFMFSPAASQIVIASGDKVEQSGEATDMSFFAGEKLRLSIKSTDDVFVAGGDVVADNVKADHLVMAGGDITITGVEVNDIMVAGGKLNMKSGTVSDDIVAAAGDLTLYPEFNIGGSAVLTGGNLTIDTPINGELRVAAGRVRLNADVVGDVQLISDDIVIGPDVKITGDLRYRADDFEVSPTAVIIGETIQLAEGEYENFETWGKYAAAFFAIFLVAVFLGLILLVVAVCMALPGLMRSSSKMIREKPLPTLAIGFLITVILPVAFSLLFRSVLGLPLALLIGVIYIAVAPIAIAASAYFLGMEGRKRLGKKKDDAPGLRERLLWPAGAILFLVFLGLIPFVGKLVWLLAFVFGLGAVATRGGGALARIE